MIREDHGDYFCIAVAAYPEVHTEAWNNVDLPPSEQARILDLQRLLEKQQAGADFIISQFFFDVDNVVLWMKECRKNGITIPILPGYLPIQNYQSFKKFTSWCKTEVPSTIQNRLETCQSDDQAVKEYGVAVAIETCQTLLNSGCQSLHFYTMNLANAVTKILAGMDLIPIQTSRALPWNSALPRRQSHGGVRSDTVSTANRYEEVRPIFWANRQSSYIARTVDWDDYPNGRWGNRKSPAYGELSEYYLAFKRPKVDRKVLWGQPENEKDVWNTFVNFLDGKIKNVRNLSR